MNEKHEPIDLAMMCQMLDFISADRPRDDWAALLMSAKSEFGDQAKTVMQAWSSKADNYDRLAFNSTWKSIKAGGGITIATLIQTAKDSGYQFKSISKTDRNRLAKEQGERKRLRLEAEKREEQDTALRQKEAAIFASEFIKNRAAKVNPNHPYFIKKHLANAIKELGATSYLYQYYQSIIVPLYQFDEFGKINICSLQYIDEGGRKIFLKGGKTKGAFFPLRFDGYIFSIVICEGLATAMTYALYYDQLSEIVVAFNAKNLKHVARSFKNLYPKARIIIAGDNDVQTEIKTGINPGVKAAQQAAIAVDAELSIPVFNDGEFGTDWNDRFVLDSMQQEGSSHG